MTHNRATERATRQSNSEQARERFDNLALVVGQVEQVVDRFVYVIFEVVNVCLLNFLPVGFEAGQQSSTPSIVAEQ